MPQTLAVNIVLATHDFTHNHGDGDHIRYYAFAALKVGSALFYVVGGAGSIISLLFCVILIMCVAINWLPCSKKERVIHSNGNTQTTVWRRTEP